MVWLQSTSIQLYLSNGYFYYFFLKYIVDCKSTFCFYRCMAFEKAYCLYRLNRTQEALAALTKEANVEAKHKELKAQILYRMEKYETFLRSCHQFY